MKLSFTSLTGEYAITRMPALALLPDWADGVGLVNITRANDELSIVCLANRAPDIADTGWTALRVDTLATLDEPGVVMAALTPISTAGLGVFVISTHLRDYLLVRTAEMNRVKTALTDAGHTIA
ncbi:hypothetical protein OAN307_c04990 [Octadecabacter antarcticus 307]|uniref:Uncharacterized protein n=1 Tax=Octadecabacter antarcticus 307 TaxID=391626 RepID=M9R1W8_9RHOB|nr:ACT domain-containing protein [Octadecabacter antarcticus]AGI66237.1 hypothetical protein OAN307_c04990 [Octadecabacter antarcticus 307]